VISWKTTRRQIDRVGGLDRRAQLTHDLLLGNFIDRREVALDVDREVALRQIAHVTHARRYTVAAAKVFLNRLRLCGRLDDN
jgi:hypothetical protein